MIDFAHIWLPQIVDYAAMIGTGRLEEQWLGRRELFTSVTNPDELYEQIFDDLDADNIWIEARQRSQLPAPTVDAIDRFLAALHDIDESNAATLVSSTVWLTIREAANVLVANVRS